MELVLRAFVFIFIQMAAIGLGSIVGMGVPLRKISSFYLANLVFRCAEKRWLCRKEI